MRTYQQFSFPISHLFFISFNLISDSTLQAIMKLSEVKNNQNDRLRQSTMEGDDEEEMEASIEMEEMEAEEEKEELSREDMFVFRRSTVEGRWAHVIDMYETHSNFRTVEVNKSRDTAVHVAVNDGKEDVVKRLVEAIIEHENQLERQGRRYVKALELKNERGDTPLHLAATRGFREICECIIGGNGERKELINIDNEEEETPLFHAALSWQRQTFTYLSSLMPAESVDYSKHLVRKNGDSILHCAIRREFIDLALIIMNKYPNLYDIQNGDGFSPLKLLATRPSAFRSGSQLIWWKRILYHCIPVETLCADTAIRSYMQETDEPGYNMEFPENYRTCCHFFRKLRQLAALIFASGNKGSKNKLPFTASGKGEVEDVPEEDQHCQISIPEDSRGLIPGNYATCLQFVKFVYVYVGLSALGIGDIRKMKQKHKWSRQLLSEFMKKPYESYMGSGGSPPPDVTDVTYKPEDKISQNETSTKQVEPQKTNKMELEVKIDKEETAFLASARNGIVEMVNELLSKIPSAIHESNSQNKNVLLVAVENKQPLVVEALRNWFKKDKNENLVFNNLILGVDDKENTVLHLAAMAPRDDKAWRISGSALQMIGDIKWFQYIKELVPEHFTIRHNKDGKTPGEIFEASHKQLIKDGSEWLKDTSESCSVVAALLAGVSFATSSTVPGGNNNDTGKPVLEGQPAFEVFGIASLIGLCFSVTALIMFLSILTSRKDAKDFSKDLPRKLLFGLSSLFISIVAMIVSFCAGHFFLLENKYKQILFLVYSITCLPVSFYAIAQFPLYIDLVRATTKKVPHPGDRGDNI